MYNGQVMSYFIFFTGHIIIIAMYMHDLQSTYSEKP